MRDLGAGRWEEVEAAEQYEGSEEKDERARGSGRAGVVEDGDEE